jgi:hypothetical protein
MRFMQKKCEKSGHGCGKMWKFILFMQKKIQKLCQKPKHQQYEFENMIN